MPWQTPEYYQEEAITLRPEAFDRLHLNRWVSSTSSFIPSEWWDACKVEAPLPLSPEKVGPAIVLAADASVSGDCSAVVAVHRNPAPGKSDDVVLSHAQAWTPPPGGTIDYGTTIEPYLRRLITGHIHPIAESCTLHSRVWELGVCEPVPPLNVVSLVYDMYQLHDMMMRFRNEGLVWVRSFSQGADRMVADFQLYTFIRDRRITHYGNPDVREHLGNAAAKQSSDSNTKLRLVKKSKGSKIDLIVATSMASYECKRLLL